MATWPKETDDDFFGGQEEDIRDISRQPQAQTDAALSVDQTPDGLAERDSRAMEERFRNLGYHEAFDEARDARLQDGFELGYKQCFHAAMKMGELLGEVTSPLGDDLSRTENSKRVSQHVRTFLDTFQQEEDPTKTPKALAELTEQIHELMVKKESS
jgi:flagellar biosynthesis/type III secretory pathway protein FliH